MSTKSDSPCTVRVGSDLGVVLDRVPAQVVVPEDHVAVWFGETVDDEHRIRTVPVEYCVPVEHVDVVH